MGISGREHLKARVHERREVSARSHDVRFDETFVGGAGRGKRRDTIVGWIVRREIVGHRADRDHVRGIPRHRDRLRSRAVVARGGDDDDSSLPEFHHRLVDRIVPVKRFGRRSEGQVEHADRPVRGAIGIDPVESIQHACIGRVAIAVERLHADEAHHRSDALRLSLEHGIGGVGACDQADDVRAMTVIIVHARVAWARMGRIDEHIVDRIELRHHAIGAVQIRGQIREGFLLQDPAVEHRHGDPRAVDALSGQLVDADHRPLVNVGRGVRQRRGRLGLDRRFVEHPDVAVTAQARGLLRREQGRHRVDDRQLVRHPSAHLAHRAGCVGGASCLDDEAVAVGFRGLGGGPGAGCHADHQGQQSTID